VSGSYWLRAPERPDGKQFARDPRPADGLVPVITHDAADRPAHKLLGCIEFTAVGMSERLELGSDE